MRQLSPALIVVLLCTPPALLADNGPADFAADTGLPAAWQMCHESEPGRQMCRELLAGPAETGGMRSAGDGRWVFSRTDHRHMWRMKAPGPADWPLVVSPGAAFAPLPLAGLGAMYNGVKVVIVNGDGYRVVEAEDAPITIGAGDWVGVRTRFWAWLIQPASGSLTVTLAGTEGSSNIGVAFDGGSGADLLVYAGPVERMALVRADPALTKLLYAALWDWLRWLCFAMAWLYGLLVGVIGDAGLAIVALSLVVKVLMLPLTRVADRWQSDVHTIQSRLQPELDDIKSRFRGEEANDRTLAVYRDHGIHPLYTLKSLAGFMIQVPVFIAAFDMLGESFTLYGAGFLWIRDLAWPDAVAALPIAIPLLGATLNVLPFAMTALTIVASALQSDASLTPVLQRKQQLRLYAMAVAFFVLLYAFPAGMVLYWTTSNLAHLVKVVWGRLLTSAN